ncbi:MAG: diaminopimelate epimerase [Eubacteriales bacterium]|nr:diaminopimelate epimerase [Eubacteriales bacterium]
MELEFTKMHGCGNDYIYFNCFTQKIDNPEGLSVGLSDRHKGIGGDGIVLICPSAVADAKMRMFNIDGSEGRMCGNAIRCVGKYLYEKGLVDKLDITIETLSGIKKLKLFNQDGEIFSVQVNMGKAELTPQNIPVALDGESVIGRMVDIAGSQQRITAVSMGNPHCVVFVDSVDEFDVAKIGPMFENSPLFPERVNTEFIKMIDDHTIKMRVWERGSGETWACGTGACAAVVAACENGFCKKNEDITVKLRGGDLVIRYNDDKTVYMTGNAIIAFEGVVKI